MRRPATILVIALTCGAGLSSCRLDTDAQLPLYRCLGELRLADLIETVGLPQPQPSPWVVPTSEVAVKQQFFDLEQETTLTLKDAGPFVGSLCRQLQVQLARRCQVQTFWPGSEHCAAVVEAPAEAITGKGGVYTHQGFKARVNLFSSPRPDGKVKVVLTGSEWVN